MPNDMTLEKFKNQGWGYGMQAEYKGAVYPVISVDFEESLVGLSDVIPNLDEITWVRCENISLHNAIGEARADNAASPHDQTL